MLTFFDYLRQRAFNSVLAGVHEALEVLETQQNRSEEESADAKLPTAPPTAQAGKSAMQSKHASAQSSNSKSDDELLPAPRRRGRPGKNSKGRA